MMRSLLLISIALIGTARLLVAQETPSYSTAEAAKHVGETATVCGHVDSVHISGRGNAFINLDGAYPNQGFTAFIPAASARAAEGLYALKQKNVCVTGKIAIYRGKPEIVISDKTQIEVK